MEIQRTTTYINDMFAIVVSVEWAMAACTFALLRN